MKQKVRVKYIKKDDLTTENYNVILERFQQESDKRKCHIFSLILDDIKARFLVRRQRIKVDFGELAEDNFNHLANKEVDWYRRRWSSILQIVTKCETESMTLSERREYVTIRKYAQDELARTKPFFEQLSNSRESIKTRRKNLKAAQDRIVELQAKDKAKREKVEVTLKMISAILLSAGNEYDAQLSAIQVMVKAFLDVISTSRKEEDAARKETEALLESMNKTLWLLGDNDYGEDILENECEVIEERPDDPRFWLCEVDFNKSD